MLLQDHEPKALWVQLPATKISILYLLCCTPEPLAKLCVGLLMLAQVVGSFRGFNFSKSRSQLYSKIQSFWAAFLQEDTPASGQFFWQSAMLLKMVWAHDFAFLQDWPAFCPSSQQVSGHGPAASLLIAIPCCFRAVMHMQVRCLLVLGFNPSPRYLQPLRHWRIQGIGSRKVLGLLLDTDAILLRRYKSRFQIMGSAISIDAAGLFECSSMFIGKWSAFSFESCLSASQYLFTSRCVAQEGFELLSNRF